MLAARVEPIPKRLTTLPTPRAALYLVVLFFFELSPEDSRSKVIGRNLTGHHPNYYSMPSKWRWILTISVSD
jgi:hypothetical protein